MLLVYYCETRRCGTSSFIYRDSVNWVSGKEIVVVRSHYVLSCISHSSVWQINIKLSNWPPLLIDLSRRLSTDQRLATCGTCGTSGTWTLSKWHVQSPHIYNFNVREVTHLAGAMNVGVPPLGCGL